MSTFLQEPDENEEPEDDQGGEEQQDTDQDDDPTEEGEPDAEEVGWAGEEVGEQQDRARSRKSQARANNKKTKWIYYTPQSAQAAWPSNRFAFMCIIEIIWKCMGF